MFNFGSVTLTTGSGSGPILLPDICTTSSTMTPHGFPRLRSIRLTFQEPDDEHLECGVFFIFRWFTWIC